MIETGYLYPIMNKQHAIDLVCKQYSPLSAECQVELAGFANILSLKKETQLVREGEYSDKTFFIVSGCARAFYIKDGKDISDWFAFENDFISSIKSFFLNIPSLHYIELLEDSTIVVLVRDDVQKLSDKFHDFERLTKMIAIRTMLQQQERIASMQFHSAEEKYENLLSIHPNITQRLALTHIASYIGITLETLSRIRKPKK